MIALVILLGAIMAVVSVRTALFSLTELDVSTKRLATEQIKQQAQGCLSEAILHLRKNSSFTTSTVNIGGGSCTTTVTGGGNDRVITVVAVQGVYNYTLHATVTISPFVVSEWGN